MRKSSYAGEYGDPIGKLSRMSGQEEEEGGTSSGRITEELKKEEERVINKIYQED